eukprot:7492766-Alexandrium_andersonii.AAC.1
MCIRDSACSLRGRACGPARPASLPARASADMQRGRPRRRGGGRGGPTGPAPSARRRAGRHPGVPGQLEIPQLLLEPEQRGLKVGSRIRPARSDELGNCALRAL